MTTASSSEDTEYLSIDSSTIQNDVNIHSISRQHAANMSKRRFRHSELQREKVTPSQVNRIKNIFEAAASHSAILSQPPRRISRDITSVRPSSTKPSQKTVRLSAHKTDSDYPINPWPASTLVALPLKQTAKVQSSKQTYSTAKSSPDKLVKNPPGSSKSTPSRIPRPIRQVSTIDLNAGFTYGADSDDEDLHSTHGVPLILPIRESKTNTLQKEFTVSQWLKNIEVPVLDGDKKTADRHTTAAIQSSPLAMRSKENSDPRHTKTLLSRAISKAPIPGIRSQESRDDLKLKKSIKTISQHQPASGSPLKKSTPSTGLLLLPPRRKGQTPGNSILPHNANTAFPSGSPSKKLGRYHYKEINNQDISLEQADPHDDLVELSPSVTKYRKHRNHARNNPNTGLPANDPFSNTDLADFIRDLEAADREEEEQRGRSIRRP